MTETKGLFVTGTDTGAGKTHISAGLIRGLRQRGKSIRVRKPVESGCTVQDSQLVPQDARLLNEAAGEPESLEQVCPYRFAAAVSPERAARSENINVSLQDLVTACHCTDGRFLLVEGAGGFYSPIAPGCLNADLAQALNLPVILVAADRLGVINHVLLTMEALRHRNLHLLAVVLNRTTATVSSADMNNRDDLRAWLQVPVIPTPFTPHPGDDRIVTALAPLLETII